MLYIDNQYVRKSAIEDPYFNFFPMKTRTETIDGFTRAVSIKDLLPTLEKIKVNAECKTGYPLHVAVVPVAKWSGSNTLYYGLEQEVSTEVIRHRYIANYKDLSTILHGTVLMDYVAGHVVRLYLSSHQLTSSVDQLAYEPLGIYVSNDDKPSLTLLVKVETEVTIDAIHNKKHLRDSPNMAWATMEELEEWIINGLIKDQLSRDVLVEVVNPELLDVKEENAN